MEGVNILNVIVENSREIWLATSIIPGVIAVICGIYAIIDGYTIDWEEAIPAGVISFVCICVTIIMVNVGLNGTRYNKYEVTIDDTVSMNEFYEHYEVEEQRGAIWVVVEKDK